METENKPVAKRLKSLDALRGFDMFWIMGGEGIFVGLASLTGWPVLKWWAGQLSSCSMERIPFLRYDIPDISFYCRYIIPFLSGKTYMQIMTAENQFINMLSAAG